MDRAYKASYFEQRFRNKIYETVVRALEDECKTQHWKRKDLAERVGRKESQISRCLSVPSNWTLDTVSNLLFSIDSELDFRVTKFKDKAKRNEFHELNEPLIVKLNFSKSPSLPKPFEKFDATSSS